MVIRDACVKPTAAVEALAYDLHWHVSPRHWGGAVEDIAIGVTVGLGVWSLFFWAATVGPREQAMRYFCERVFPGYRWTDEPCETCGGEWSSTRQKYGHRVYCPEAMVRE